MDNLWLAYIFFLPAGLANAAPVIANRIPVLNRWTTPLDFGMKYRGQPIFGANKSWRGVLSGVLVGMLLGVLFFPWLGALDHVNHAILGGALGLGALIGDAVESFLKRRFGVKPGESWFPFDQIDYILGGLLFSLPFIRLRPVEYGVIAILYFCLHLAGSYVGYLLHLKSKPI